MTDSFPQRLGLLASLSIASLGGCTDIAELPYDVCGNGVIEANEDCDGVGIDANTCNGECRLTCTAELRCPVGWGCGSDGLCRQPSGAFSAEGTAVALPASSLEVADLDGDGTTDVVASQGSTVALAFVDSAGFLPEVTTLSVEPIDEFPDRPAVGDLDGDGRSDLVVRVGDGLAVLRGAPEQRVLSFPFLRNPPAGYEPGDTLFAADFDRSSKAPGDELFAVRPDGLYLVETYDLDTDVPLQILEWEPGPVPHVTLVNVQLVRTEPLLTTSSSVGADFVIAREGDDFVTVFEGFVSQLENNEWVAYPNFMEPRLREPLRIELPKYPPPKSDPMGPTKDVVVAGPVQVVAITTADGEARDLLIPGMLDGEPVLSVALRDSDSPNGYGFKEDLLAHPFEFRVNGEVLTEAPLGVGRFNNDGVFDFIDAEGIYVSTCPSGFSSCGFECDDDNCPDLQPLYAEFTSLAIPEGDEAWTGAYVLDGSSLQKFQGDVLTTSDKPGFSFFKLSDGAFARFQFPTSSPVEDVTVGDFNADGARDIAFTQISERATPEMPDVRSLSVSFGDAFGAVSSLFSGRVPDITQFPDALDDVYAVTEDEQALFVFRGSTDRTILSPLELALDCPEDIAPLGAARVFAIGEFDSEEGRDVALLSQDIDDDGAFSWELATLRVEAQASLEVCDTLSLPTEVADPGSDELLMLGIRLDVDAATEDLAVLPVGTNQLLVFRSSGSEWVAETVPLPLDATALQRVSLPAGPALAFVSETSVALGLPDGAGSVVLGPALELAGTPCPNEDGGNLGLVRSVTSLASSADGTRELLVATDGDVARVAISADGDLTLARCDAETFGGGVTALASGDFDGDGVEDVVVARAGAARLYLGVPVVR
jgi:hypothetical protein